MFDMCMTYSIAGKVAARVAGCQGQDKRTACGLDIMLHGTALRA